MPIASAEVPKPPQLWQLTRKTQRTHLKLLHSQLQFMTEKGCGWQSAKWTGMSSRAQQRSGQGFSAALSGDWTMFTSVRNDVWQHHTVLPTRELTSALMLRVFIEAQSCRPGLLPAWLALLSGPSCGDSGGPHHIAHGWHRLPGVAKDPHVNKHILIMQDLPRD